MSNMKRGERRAMTAAKLAAATLEPPPPGETGRELTGGAAVDALREALLSVTLPDRRRFTLTQLDGRIVNGRDAQRFVLMDCVLVDDAGREHVGTLLVNTKHVKTLRDTLAGFLGQILRKGDR